MVKKSKEELEKEKEEVQTLLSQIEEEYRRASISEETYKEMKEKYEKKLKEINKKLGIKEEKEEKKSFLDKLLGKKEEKKEGPYEETKTEGPVYFDPLNPPKEILEEVKPEEKKELKIESEKIGTEVIMEIEKFRATLDAFREEKKVMMEQIRAINESIGELRSLIFQTDGALKELEINFNKLAAQVEEITPDKIAKRFIELEKNIEKFNVFIEKTEKKIEDLNERVNKVFEFLRTAGSLENIIEVSKKIDEKAREIKDAISYIERVATKVEKTFIEMTRNLQDFTIYKTRQESVEDSLKEVLKNISEINAKIENLATNKDLDAVRSSIAILDTQIKEFEKSLPLIDAKIPETIKRLRDERDDLIILLESLKNQLKEGKISIGDYEKSKANTEKRIKEIEDKLIEEWKRVEKFLEGGGIEFVPATEAKVEEKETKKEKLVEEIPVEEEGYVELAPFSFKGPMEVIVKSKKKAREVKLKKRKVEIFPKPVKEIKAKSKEEFKKVVKKLFEKKKK
ncbi:MAG: hypothetical protein RMJ17_01855 [Candidatus Aenigmarchaeota archaeon]|nr:hypothetical protein [Candidatus Aenigmarchaeota archaeon]MDW8149320.1 hypothetical protein [Candidatus Aenigmarchaeota archaeon]